MGRKFGVLINFNSSKMEEAQRKRCNSSLLHLSHSKTNLDEEEGKKEEEKMSRVCLGSNLANELNGVHLHLLISPILHKTPFTFTIYDLSQMNVYLINFKPNGLKSTTKVNVLFEIHALVSRVSVFDEIRENSYLRKSPRLSLNSI